MRLVSLIHFTTYLPASIKMTTKPACVFLCSVAVLLLLIGAPTAVESVTCDPSQLFPCAGSIKGSSPPSSQCCAALRSQSPCFCQYMKDPKLAPFISRARQVAAICRVSLPSCK
ncbi:non-specific lipid-transfer protein 2-like [Zingiber officinale]|uniref:non-specific lipid-transfer protein 2-like n=1 Tax=Zingiber officinale TaxID=94328 RepID=UPI001C4CF05C|nr:non-specific lipid-transfer protein 2-like [Zingiber officinale]